MAEFTTDQLIRPAKVLDTEHLNYNLQRNPQRIQALLEIIQCVINNGSKPIKDARSAIKHGKPQHAAHLFYSLRGDTRNLGGMRVSELASDLQTLLNQAQPNIRITDNLLEYIEKEHKLFLKELSQWHEEHQNSFNVQTRLKIREALEQKKILQEELEAYNLAAVDTFAALRAYLLDELPLENFCRLNEAIADLDFGKAVIFLASPNFKAS